MKIRAPVLALLLLGTMALSCGLPSFGPPTPFTLPTPNLTLTAIFGTLPTTTPGEASPTTPATPPTATATTEALATPTPTSTVASLPSGTSAPLPTATPSSHTSRPNGSPVAASLVSTPPTIDGDLSDWGTLPFPAGSVVYGASAWAGGNDLSATFSVAWDATKLYLAVHVTDNAFVQLSTGELLYEGDSIEIQFDRELSVDYYEGTLSTDDYQLGLSPGNFGSLSPEAYRWRPMSKSGPLPSATVRGKKTAQGWDLEAAIPWSAFDVVPSINARFGFALSVSDDDLTGIADQQTMVSSVGTRQWGDPTTWGTLILNP